jgi:hypothetical protein
MRFGRKRSNFTIIGFNFSAQQDARFHGEKDSIITFFNNVAGMTQRPKTSTYSYALIVALDTSASPATATVKQYPRPDARLSDRCGNTQILLNTNVFIGWTSNGYPSEFAAAGRLALETCFTSGRLRTYQAYRFNFASLPTGLSVLKTCIWRLPGDDDISVLRHLERCKGGVVLKFPCCAESVRVVQIDW